jgi:hypothetical protein
LRIVTDVGCPACVRTRQVTTPAGVSSVTVAAPPGAATRPVSTSIAPSAIAPCPHMCTGPSGSMKSTPTCASGATGSVRIAPHIAAWPRGS